MFRKFAISTFTDFCIVKRERSKDIHGVHISQ